MDRPACQQASSVFPGKSFSISELDTLVFKRPVRQLGRFNPTTPRAGASCSWLVCPLFDRSFTGGRWCNHTSGRIEPDAKRGSNSGKTRVKQGPSRHPRAPGVLTPNAVLTQVTYPLEFFSVQNFSWCPMIVERLGRSATRRAARRDRSGQRPWPESADATGHRATVGEAFAQPSRSCSCTW